MIRIAILLFYLPFTGVAQTINQQIIDLTKEVEVLESKKGEVQSKIDELKLAKIRQEIAEIGLPKPVEGEEVISHLAYSLVYDENHEQAKWVVHIISTDIIDGKASRSNNFRVDTLVKTGSATEKDYFLKTKKLGEKNKYEYDGFGYDRGHLAPSADFKWNKKALSESFYYSNMSPQLADFNRKKWAKLEGLMRGYVENNNEQLFIVTGPILNDSLPVIERGENQVTIPEYFYKVALDYANKKAIGFIMPNKDIKNPISSFAVSINEVEMAAGIDFFYQLDDELEEQLESQNQVSDWLPESQETDVTPIYQPSLPPGVFNTVQAKNYIGNGKKITVKGTVVNARETKNGHLFFNLDKNYPNQIFTVAIWKQNIVNFSYNPLVEWMNKKITISGKIADFDGVPTMILEKENSIEFDEDPKYKMIVE
ncbi:DNA/RNA non-specific endonuclease [Vicingus serpentipes]|uniref:DNA/RNA non-specific endonuclease n=1 Tax=Vicingus serpentipes TaxID=1926625 RepID=A0A5C6RUG7_9FLAO|nr:DNA/RNA non-specific endonuclease [Vicingus serpentipes]TXB66136.1 DNA/RNA non-specific endonuclease [Vicingus serpentipes]